MLKTEHDLTPGRDGAAWLAADHVGFEWQVLAENTKSREIRNIQIMTGVDISKIFLVYGLITWLASRSLEIQRTTDLA